jgi:hypothetical protein
VIPVHGPIHDSWLNQIEIYFSILQRKALTPTTSARSPRSTTALAFQHYYEAIATPFEWQFTKDDLSATNRARSASSVSFAERSYDSGSGSRFSTTMRSPIGSTTAMAVDAH